MSPLIKIIEVILISFGVVGLALFIIFGLYYLYRKCVSGWEVVFDV